MKSECSAIKNKYLASYLLLAYLLLKWASSKGVISIIFAGDVEVKWLTF